MVICTDNLETFWSFPIVGTLPNFFAT